MFEALTKSFTPAANSLTSMQKTAPVEAAQASLRTTGARVTQPRVQVLATLLGSDKALSHHEIEALLAGQSIDRVTVYRVLDWLVGQKLAHRISGQDRIWRFGAVVEGAGNHGHFQCVACGSVLCLRDVPEQKVTLPQGYRQARAELAVTGTCAECAQ
jgi:Fur family transcriptional regulator, ferric uptake regulator